MSAGIPKEPPKEEEEKYEESLERKEPGGLLKASGRFLEAMGPENGSFAFTCRHTIETTKKKEIIKKKII